MINIKHFDSILKWKSLLNFASADQYKEVLTKYTELLDGIKNLIKYNCIEKNDKPGEYGKDCIEIKFNSNNLL